MTTDRAANERYNRRTRAIERQARALDRIADAFTVSALAQTASAKADTSSGTSRAWTVATARGFMTKLSDSANRLN